MVFTGQGSIRRPQRNEWYHWDPNHTRTRSATGARVPGVVTRLSAHIEIRMPFLLRNSGLLRFPRAVWPVPPNRERPQVTTCGTYLPPAPRAASGSMDAAPAFHRWRTVAGDQLYMLSQR